MKKFLWLLVAFLLAITPARAISEKDGIVNIAAGAQTINLGGTFAHVKISLSATSSTVNVTVNHGVTASASNYLVNSGDKVEYGMATRPIDPTDQINYFGNGTTGTLSWIAW